MNNQHNRLLNDKEFLSQFENLSLEPEHFDHIGHLRLAWLYLSRYDEGEAVDKICLNIDRYATNLGATEKFNLTLTNAIASIMAKRVRQQKVVSWQTFLKLNKDLVDDLLGIVEQHYSPALLFSDKAKCHKLSPDRQPL